MFTSRQVLAVVFLVAFSIAIGYVIGNKNAQTKQNQSSVYSVDWSQPIRIVNTDRAVSDIYQPCMIRDAKGELLWQGKREEGTASSFVVGDNTPDAVVITMIRLPIASR